MSPGMPGSPAAPAAPGSPCCDSKGSYSCSWGAPRGEAAEEAHREAGALAARLGIDFLVAAGREAERVASGAKGAGMDPTHVRVVESSEAAGPSVREIVRRGDWVLVKGSRSMRMVRVAEYLEAEACA